MRLYHQATRSGGWDPSALDLTADRRDWERLTAPERDLLRRLTALFRAGELGMTSDAAPLLLTVAREQRVEEALFLATLVADEARHTEFFWRVLHDVCGETEQLERYYTPTFRALFLEDLPRAMRRLLDDASPAAQAEAFVTYAVVSEGVLSETGHHLYLTALRHRGLFPGLLQGLLHVKRDEARHLTYGVYYLARLVAEDPAIWRVVERRMNALLADALGVITEFFEPYQPLPFGLTIEDTVSYAMTRFARRAARIERAGQRGAEIAQTMADPADEVAEWLGGQVESAAIAIERDGGAGGVLLRVRHEGGVATVALGAELLDRYLAEEIVSMLEEEGLVQRLRAEPELRLACVDAGGRIVVQ